MGACCYHDAAGAPVCVVTSSAECQLTFLGVYQGDGTNCDPPPCSQLTTGACCYTDATGPHCAVLYPLECELRQGQYQGNGTTCNPNPCPQAEGACCYRDATGQWVCVIVTQDACKTQYGGLYQGDNTNCGPPLPCQGVEPNGACCYQDAVGQTQCIVVSAHECDVVYHGVYHGDGSPCDPNTCVEVGACCYGEGGAGLPTTCVITTALDCQNVYHGTFYGVGSSCNPSPCEPTGACCYGTPANCIVTTQTSCEQVYNGTYLGNNVPCDPNACIPSGACCVRDNLGGSFCVIATQMQCVELLLGTYIGNGTPCTPETCPNTPQQCNCPGRCDNRTPMYRDPNFAVFTGPAAICTHHDPFVTSNSLVMVEISNKGSAPLNTNWNAATLYSPALWSLTNLGTVFGVTADKNGNVYVTASTSYYTHATGLGGWGTVYKIDTNTAAPSVFANLPNTGPGLGNICYDAANDQLFVTNFEDGRIYRLDMAGTCLSTFSVPTGVIGGCATDPNDPNGFVPLGQRPWGVNVWNGRLYYGLWVEDSGRPSAAANSVWSIALAGGNFSGVPQLEITLPPLGAWYNFSNPPSDISFSQTGCMLISERSMWADDGPSAHQSRVLEYRQIGPVWWPTAVTYQLGVIGNGENSSGGADYDQDGDVWATGDALQFSPQVIYGLQGLPCTGGGVAQSILVDLNGNLSFQDKTLLGDVEVTCFTARGACCYNGPDGPICAVMTAIECEQLQGQYQGDGTPCDPNTCVPTGACCYGNPAACIVTTAAECDSVYHGTYLGDNVPCGPATCESTGACCVRDGSGNSFCVTATQTECVELLLGTYFGDGSLCTPDRCPKDNTRCDCVSGCDSKTPELEDPAFAPFVGSSVVATQYDPLNSNRVVVCVDISGKGSAPLNMHWGTTRYSHPTWDPNNLGTVFGVTVDGNGNIYVAASTSYAMQLAGLGGWGAVYKLDALTGAISTFATLPNTGPGLGNINYDAANNQLFVTNFEDGRIYRLSMTGACLSTFSHATGIIGGCAADPNDPAGFVPLGERPWGVAVYNNRLYYGLWTEDMGRPSATAANTIWSIALSGGNFSGAPQLEITLPPLPGNNYSAPPSEINFARTGCILISERTMYQDMMPSAHASRVLEYRKIGLVWWPSSAIFGIGVFNGTNAAGGADYDEDGDVWATGDALQFGPQYIYGVQGTPCNGGDPNNSILVDLNGVFTSSDKTWIGALKVTCNARCTPPPRTMVAWFPFDETSGTVARDIAWGNHGAYTGTTSVAGEVLAARRFNGTTDQVKVPNAPQLNFGQGNFSVDLWLRTNTSVLLPVILDKRSSVPQGYSLFLYNGQPGIQLADGSSFGNFIAIPNVADGTWHHVAVTVNRTSATGIKFYIDGAFVQAFSPLALPGSLSNPNPLWIGVREPALGGGGYFPGDLDEIELFNSELSPAAVARLYQAGYAGKCKERAYLPPVTTYCPYENVKTVPFTIFNDSSYTYSHNWFLLGNTNCAVPGPTAAGFAPQNMTGVVIPGLSNQSWNINITRPPGLVPPLSACYDATVTNTTLGTTFGASASLKAIGWKWCILIEVPDTGVLGVPFPGHRSGAFGVTNSDSQPATLDYRIVAQSSDGDPEVQVVSLNGLPPGVPVTGSLLVEPGATTPLPVEVAFSSHEPFIVQSVVLEADEDGDGTMEPLAAFGARSVPLRPGDTNCDGVISYGDINPFVVALSGQSAYEAKYPECPWLNADVNGDGVVSYGDINPFVQLLSTGG